MIRLVMLGRLGKNLFQSAIGRVLAEKHGVPLVMDASWYNSEGWIQVECLRQLPGFRSPKARVVRRASLAARGLTKLTGKHYWEYRRLPMLREKETNQAFDERFLNAPSDCILFGYFQTPLYFKSIEDQLREELCTDHLGLERDCEPLALQLRKTDSVAIHVRRGDYVGNHILDICNMDYYDRAIQKMRQVLTNPTFYIFSDDPEWCAQHFMERDMNIVRPQQNSSPLANLHLMSLASHHVIANSSFSWWAAWMGKKDQQQVVTPGVWFSGIQAPIDEKLCPGWQTI
jgi:hypothetical protein